MNYVARLCDTPDMMHTWNELGEEIPFGGERWISFVRHLMPDLGLLPVLVYRDGQPISRFAATLSANPGVSIRQPLAQTLVTGAMKRFPLLTGYVPQMHYGGWNLPVGEEVPILRSIAAELERQARKHHAPFVVFGYLSPAQKDWMAQVGYPAIEMDPATFLEVTWKTFEDYEDSLHGGDRKSFRQDNNRAKRMGVAVGVEEFCSEHEQRLIALFDEVNTKYDTPPVPARLLEFAARLPKDECLLLVARIQGEIVGCGLVMMDRHMIAPMPIGVDQRFKNVYFQIMYAWIRYGIEHNARVICGGNGAYEVKQRLGFQTCPSYAAVTSPYKPLRYVINKLVARSGSKSGI